jgi:hypothetical protein
MVVLLSVRLFGSKPNQKTVVDDLRLSSPSTAGSFDLIEINSTVNIAKQNHKPIIIVTDHNPNVCSLETIREVNKKINDFDIQQHRRTCCYEVSIRYNPPNQFVVRQIDCNRCFVESLPIVPPKEAASREHGSRVSRARQLDACLALQ